MHPVPDPQRLLDQLATPWLVLDRDRVVRALAPALSSWLGLSARRLLGQPLAALAPGDGTLETLVARVDGGAVQARRVRLAPDPDRERFADVSAAPLLDGDERAGTVLEFRPVDEFPGEDPLRAVPGALHESLRGLAHEVRNPLAGLRGAAQLLARRVEEPDAAKLIALIIAEADRLTALVERLLHPPPPRPLVPTNVHEVLERVRVLAESDAGWSVAIQRDYDPSLPPILGDADRLTQAVWNLVRNALEASATEVRLRTRVERQVPIAERVWRLAVRVEVADDGHGVDDTLAASLFLPLVSGRADGTGLGLTLAQQVAREHGGMLSYRSRPGHTVFTLLLPAADEEPDEA